MAEYPRDEFDDVPEDGARQGAHRGYNPHASTGSTRSFIALLVSGAVALGVGAVAYVNAPQSEVQAGHITSTIQGQITSSYQGRISTTPPAASLGSAADASTSVASQDLGANLVPSSKPGATQDVSSPYLMAAQDVRVSAPAALGTTQNGQWSPSQVPSTQVQLQPATNGTGYTSWYFTGTIPSGGYPVHLQATSPRSIPSGTTTGVSIVPGAQSMTPEAQESATQLPATSATSSTLATR